MPRKTAAEEASEASAGPPEIITLAESIDLIVERLLARLRADQDKLLVLPELAERLAMSTRGVTTLIARGELPEGYLIGGARRWAWTEVEKFLQGRKGRKTRKRRRGQYDRTRPDAGEQAGEQSAG